VSQWYGYNNVRDTQTAEKYISLSEFCNSLFRSIIAESSVLMHRVPTLWLLLSITDLSILRLISTCFWALPVSLATIHVFTAIPSFRSSYYWSVFCSVVFPSVVPSCVIVWLLCGVSASQANYPCRASWLFYESSYLERASPTRVASGLWVLIFISVINITFNNIISISIFYYFQCWNSYCWNSYCWNSVETMFQCWNSLSARSRKLALFSEK
jgi:hypothetical protein